MNARVIREVYPNSFSWLPQPAYRPAAVPFVMSAASRAAGLTSYPASIHDQRSTGCSRLSSCNGGLPMLMLMSQKANRNVI